MFFFSGTFMRFQQQRRDGDCNQQIDSGADAEMRKRLHVSRGNQAADASTNHSADTEHGMKARHGGKAQSLLYFDALCVHGNVHRRRHDAE